MMMMMMMMSQQRTSGCVAAASAAAVLLVLLTVSCCSPVDARTKVAPKHLHEQLKRFEVLHSSDVFHSRYRRSVDDIEAQSFMEITALGRTFKMRLHVNKAIAPFGMNITIVGASGSDTIPFDRHNYLIGELVGDDEHGSSVSLYADGEVVHGHIYTAKGEHFVIEYAGRHYENFAEFDARKEGGMPMAVMYSAADLVNMYDWLSARNATNHSFCGHGSHDHARMNKEMHDAAERDLDHMYGTAFGIQIRDDNHDNDKDNHTNARTSIYNSVPHSRSRRQQASNTANTCLAALISDSRFFAGKTAGLVTSLMMSHLDRADSVVKQSTLNGITGLRVLPRRAILYNSSATDPYYRASGFPGTTGPQDLLTLLSATSQWKDYCIAHLFTSWTFDGGVLGLAYVGSQDPAFAGGICHNYGGNNAQSLNTGFSSDLSYGSQITQLMAELVTAHEVGHNFGSPHDTVASCQGDDLSGKFLMYFQAVDGTKVNNYNFSSCSLSSISGVINSKGSCFENTPAFFCGNYKVEANETCDSGQADVCCTANCRLQVGKNCSDANEQCCLNCQLATGRNCFQEYTNDPYCRLNTTCGYSQNGTVTCPTPRNKPAGSSCGEGAKCMGTDSTPLEQRCVNFCSFYGASPCTCSTSECSVCCQHNASITTNTSATCFLPFARFSGCVRAIDVVTPAAVNNVAACFAQDASNAAATRYIDNLNADPTCTGTSCAKLLNKNIGTRCTSGVCRVNGQCEAEAESSTRIPTDIGAVQEWAKNNIVGAVLIVSLILWIPIGYIVHRYDKKKRAADAQYGLRRGSSRGTLRPKSVRREQPQPKRQPAGVSRF